MIVHFCIPDKFIQPYIDFVENNFENHIFLVLENNSQYKIRLSHNIILIKNKWQLFYVLAYFNFAKKIILHGLWDKKVNLLLLLQPWLLKKYYWIMWGKDFYFPETQGFIKKTSD